MVLTLCVISMIHLDFTMQSPGGFSQVEFQEGIKQFAGKKWESLTDSQKNLAKRFWGVITYKWRWQLAMNIPYLAIFILDRTVPAVHRFDMNLLTALTSNLPIPDFITTWFGLG